MGCVLGCFQVSDDDGEHENHETTAMVGHGFRLRCSALTQQFCDNLFQRGEVNAASSSVHVTTSPSGTVAGDHSISDTYHTPPRPLPYDNPRCSSLRRQHERFVSSGHKASSHVHEESDPMHGRNINDENSCTTDSSVSEGQSMLRLSQSSLDFQTKDISCEVTDIFPTSEEEDVCPICLEEYDSENPKITLQCVHSFHLSCIYEWMERSEACPVCGKVMLFDETSG